MKMTTEKIEQAQEMRDAGVSYRKVGAALEMGASTIQYHLDSAYRGRHAAYYATYNVDHRNTLTAYKATHYTNHRDERAVQGAVYYIANRKKKLDYQMAYRAAQPVGKRAAYNLAYHKSHLPEFAARDAIRRALIIGATVGNFAEIRAIYKRAKEDPEVRCYLCGKLIPLGRRHVDHIVPLSKGGAHRPSNLAVACDICNLKKRAKLPAEIGILL